nr:muscleblind-like protein 3 isoform X2 [Danaus plexippus plexippus]
MATMVNMNSLLNGKDSRWLQLEVCREFQRNKCSRPDTECKFAHPPATVEVQNGRVTACYDSIKGRCNREKPPCKYFHPPQHLKDQLLINGRNHLALKNALMQQMGLTPGQVLPGQVPAVATSPYLSGVPGVGSTYAQYYAPQLVPAVLGHDPSAAAASPLGVMQQPVLQQKLPRTDRLEVCREFLRGACKRAESECRFAHPPPPVVAHDDGCVTVCMDAVKGRCVRDPCRYFHPPLHLQAHLKAQARGAMDMKSVGSFYYDNFSPCCFQAFPGVVPYKRQAADKAGVPVYQPATTYQQLMQLQQPFVPVSCEYPAPASSAPPAAVTAVSGAAGPQTAPAAVRRAARSSRARLATRLRCRRGCTGPRRRRQRGRSQELRGRARARRTALRHGTRGRRLHTTGVQGPCRHAGVDARTAHDAAGLARAARAHARLLSAALHVRDAPARGTVRSRGGGGGGRCSQPLQKDEDDLRRAGGPRPEGRGVRGLRVETRTCAIVWPWPVGALALGVLSHLYCIIVRTKRAIPVSRKSR